MKYTVEFTEGALKQLKKLDKHTSAFLMAWLKKNIVGCTDPRQHGKGLVGNRSGQWRYRIGDYRVIAEIIDDRVVVLVVSVGHRREIYEN